MTEGQLIPVECTCPFAHDELYFRDEPFRRPGSHHGGGCPLYTPLNWDFNESASPFCSCGHREIEHRSIWADGDHAPRYCLMRGCRCQSLAPDTMT